jgi:hypothetical protein
MKHGSYMVWPVAGCEPGRDKNKGRFVIQEHLIHDRLTQRTWLNDKWLYTGAVSWQQALDHVKRINKEKAAGYQDLRLPNIRKLESLVDVTTHSPALAAQHAFHTIHEGYWSATTSLYEPRYAWVLYTKDGAIGVGYKPQQDIFLLAIR